MWVLLHWRQTSIQSTRFPCGGNKTCLKKGVIKLSSLNIRSCKRSVSQCDLHWWWELRQPWCGNVSLCIFSLCLLSLKSRPDWVRPIKHFFCPFRLKHNLTPDCFPSRSVSNHVSSICSTWGREHFKTFDGDVYQFSGACEYNLASDCHEALQEFSVHMRREQNDGNPTVAYVVVTINDLAFHLTKEAVTVNGQT